MQFHSLKMNTIGIYQIKIQIKLIGKDLSKNPNAIHIFEKNLDKS